MCVDLAYITNIFHVIPTTCPTLIGAGSTCEVYEFEVGTEVFVVKLGSYEAVGKRHELLMLEKCGLSPRSAIDESGRRAVMMKRVHGLPLETIYTDDARDKEKNTLVASLAMEALYKVHSQCIVHRDCNLGSVLVDLKKRSSGLVDFAGAVILDRKIVLNRQDPNCSFRRVVHMSYLTDSREFAEGVLDYFLTAAPYDTVSSYMKRPNIRERYTLQMAMVSYAILLKENDNEVDSPLSPELSSDTNLMNEMLLVLKGLRDYQAHVICTLHSSVLGLSVSHGQKSAHISHLLSCELLTVTSKAGFYYKILNFLNTYDGNFNAHSLKVLIAASLLKRGVPPTKDERIALVEDCSSYLETKITATTSHSEGPG